MNDLNNTDGLAHFDPNWAIAGDNEVIGTQGEEDSVSESTQEAKANAGEANAALNRPLLSPQFAKTIAALNRPLLSPQFAKTIAALNRPLLSPQFAKTIAALNRPLLSPQFAKTIAALNRPLLSPQFAKTIAALNRPLLSPQFAKTIAALNRPLLSPQFAKTIAAFNRQSAVFAPPNIISSRVLKQQQDLHLKPFLTMAVGANRRLPWTYSLIGPTIASGMDTLLEVPRDQLSGIDIGEPNYFEKHWLDLFDQMVSHKGLRQVCRDLFADGYYDIAVERAYIYVDNMVQAESGLASRHGADLMRAAFSAKSPVLKLNSFQSDSEEDEQRGYMDIFAGSMMGIRNPRAHEHELLNDPEVALELLVLANHLLRKLDSATKD